MRTTYDKSMVFVEAVGHPVLSVPPAIFSKLLIILLVFSLLSIAWIIAPAFALSRWLQKVCGKYSILIPLRRSFRAVRTSSRVPSLNLCSSSNSLQSVLLVLILVRCISWFVVGSIGILFLRFDLVVSGLGEVKFFLITFNNQLKEVIFHESLDDNTSCKTFVKETLNAIRSSNAEICTLFLVHEEAAYLHVLESR
ncbi:hypothetical protein Tco_0153256 [Tanacetum coccineum]